MRRLPVLSNADDLGAVRPAWQRVLIAAGFVFTLWLPASTLFQLLGAAGMLLSFAIASFVAGVLTGRFVATRPREAALGGLTTSTFLWIFAILRGALPLWPIGLLTLAAMTSTVTFSSWLGARLGQKTRTGDPTR